VSSADGREIERLRHELEQSRAVAQQFLLLVRHELKAPIHALNSFARFLKDDLAAGDEQEVAKDLDHITTGAQRLTALLDELSELAQTHWEPLACEPVDAQLALARALDELGLTSDALEVPPLPRVVAQERALVRVWRELVDNALRHGSSQGVRVSSERDGDTWVLGVEDAGPGVPAKLGERIFLPFERFGSDRDRSGLGLTIARALTQRQAGTLWLEHTPQGGAHFRFRLAAD